MRSLLLRRARQWSFRHYATHHIPKGKAVEQHDPSVIRNIAFVAHIGSASRSVARVEMLSVGQILAKPH